jgi:ABC-type xylose transport system permease subunit
LKKIYRLLETGQKSAECKIEVHPKCWANNAQDFVLAAFTGLLYVARLNAAEATIGSGFNLTTIATTLFGGTQFGGGKGSVGKTVLGVLIVLFIQNGLNILNVPSL